MSKTEIAHVVMSPNEMGGRPHLAGRRVTVANVAVWHERMGLSVAEIASEYGLGLAEIHAALAYYFDHREEIEQRLRDDEEYLEYRRAVAPPSKLNEYRRQQAGGG